MVWLVLAVACSASIALIFRFSETRQMNRYGVTAANYLMASAVALGLCIAGGVDLLPTATEGSPWRAMVDAFKLGAPLTQGSGWWFATAEGFIAGIFFFLSFLFYQVSIRRHGVGLAGAFGKLGVLVPMALSLVFWAEYPNWVQWLGISCALCSILLVYGSDVLSGGGRWRMVLVWLLICGGLAEFSAKLFQKYGVPAQKSLFLLATFATAFGLSVLLLFLKRRPLGWRDLGTGLMVGIPNLFASFFLINALEQMPAVVVFPVYGAGTILILNGVAAFLLKERLPLNQKWAVVLSCCALVLVHW